MGKYNFSAAKFAEIEKRLADLEMQNAKLLAENRLLNSTIVKKNPERNLYREVKDSSKISSLFGFSADGGFLKPTDDQAKTYNNFQTFYTNILRALKPFVREKITGQAGYRIVGTPINELNDKEWEIVVETMDAIIDTIFYAKVKMGESSINGDKK